MNAGAPFSVSEFSRLLSGLITESFGNVSIRGEISGLKVHSSGHVYFSIKDSDAVLDAICWRGNASRLKEVLTEGLEVICTGRITTYPMRSKYQIIVERAEPAGIGALLKVLEERKARLMAEGVFSGEKKPLPFLPLRIGVITSPTGAVIQDILHRLEDRMPAHVLLWPVTVQGDKAAQEVIAALEGFAKMPAHMRPEVVIVARGGGSVEDLWCFNDEALVRAVFAFPIPLISAIGHETDVTLIDFVADRRAPTPTAASEMAVPVRADLLETLRSFDHRMRQGVMRRTKEAQLSLTPLGRVLSNPQLLIERHIQTLDERRERLLVAMNQSFLRCEWVLGQVKSRLVPLSLSRLVKEKMGLWEALQVRLEAATYHIVSKARQETARLTGLLESLSYQSVLKRGFVLVTDQMTGRPVTALEFLENGAKIQLQSHKARREAMILGDASVQKV